MIKILRTHVEEMYKHAREINPQECCGLIGGKNNLTSSIYKLRNISSKPLITYDAAPEDIFSAQRLMRERGEELCGIYHSHPRSYNPIPSETDIRLAYYPSAFYFIIGLAGDSATLGVFHISEAERFWKHAQYSVIDN
jgi:[CysO sulfur-carrier protein]-S-L-cysteine hydrolase